MFKPFLFSILLFGLLGCNEAILHQSVNKKVFFAEELRVCEGNTLTKKVIVGGNPTKPGYWSTVVAIANRFSTKPHCSGVLITDRHVMTSAHCVIGEDNLGNSYDVREMSPEVAASDFTIVVGDGRDCGLEGEFIIPRRLFAHESYVHNAFKNVNSELRNYKYRDIAIFELQNPIKDHKVIPPLTDIKEIEEFIYNNAYEDVKIIGYGQRNFKWSNSVAGRKYELDTKIEEVYGHEIRTRAKPGRGSCRGDSGGAVVGKYLAEEGDLYRSLAIISRGPTECGAKADSVHTMIYEHLCWAQKKLGYEILNSEQHCLREAYIEEQCLGVDDDIQCHDINNREAIFHSEKLARPEIDQEENEDSQ